MAGSKMANAPENNSAASSPPLGLRRGHEEEQADGGKQGGGWITGLRGCYREELLSAGRSPLISKVC